MVASPDRSTTERMAPVGVGVGVERELPGLIVDTGDTSPRLVPLLARETVVGSARDCDLRIPGRFVSRRHCRLVRDDPHVLLEDLGSSNGTEVDGRRVLRTRLAPGALVHVGAAGFTLVRLTPDVPGGRAPGVCHFEGMVGVDPGTIARFHRLNQIAASAAPVLLTGPSGVGKELHARALHGRSPRRAGPFWPVNCGALPPGLAEAELFGCRRGAYTGADHDRDGAFVEADAGTLFLDEVGELPEEVQPKLLRVLETGEVFPLGGGRPRRVDVRIVAATNRNLWRDVDEGRYRADLLFRLEGMVLEVPPLSARPTDVAPIATNLLAALSGGRRALTRAATEWLVEQRWPGNVRELRNLVVAVLALTRGPEIDAADLRVAGGTRPRPALLPDGVRAGATDRAIVAALRDQAGCRKDAMHRLGMPRSTFYARLRRLRGAGVLE